MSYLARRKSKPTVKKCIESSYTTNNLPSLRRKRTIAYNRIARALDVGNLAQSDQSKVELFLSYCQELKFIANDFQEAHFIILDLLKDDVDDKDDELQEMFDDMYFQVVTLQRKFEPCDQQVDPRRDSVAAATASNIRLPKISLPTFSGDIKLWQEFISTYNALIHDCSQLTNIEKFHYLVSVLRGDALSLIRTFPVAAEHYNSAYDALRKRYENKRELAFTCWRDILEVNFKIGNAHNFRNSLDTIEENLTILKQLNLLVEFWDFILSYHILAKLDPKLRRELEEKHSDVDLPSYIQIRDFLRSKCEALIRDTHFTDRTVNNKSAPFSKEFPINSLRSKRQNVTLVSSHTNTGAARNGSPTKVSSTLPPGRKCSYCGDKHSIMACQSFLSKSTDERMAVATDRKWCYNCLNASHSVQQCTSIFSCKRCKRKHHTLLHRELPKTNSVSSDDKSRSTTLVSKEISSPSPTTVLLATAIIQIRDASGDFYSFRALFDTGSQNNFITARAAQQLRLQPIATSVNILGLGGNPAAVGGVITCDVGVNNNDKFRLDMFIVPNICGEQPIAKLNTNGWEVKTLPLADPGFDIPGPIDVLLGADVFAESLLEQRIKSTASQPQAFNSIFGWLLLGKSKLASSCLLGMPASQALDNNLNTIVQRFWEIDNFPSSSRLSPEDQLCESIFTNDHYRDETGRYFVSLPFKDNGEPIFDGSRDNIEDIIEERELFDAFMQLKDVYLVIRILNNNISIL